MIETTEIARGIYRIAMWEEEDLLQAGLLFPGATYNMFLIRADQPAIVETMFRRSFQRLYGRVKEILDPARLRYIIVPHHEGDSSGAVNEWLAVAPDAIPLCSELCAVLSLRDFADREPRVVKDAEVLDLGSHRLRFVMTPQVNQWDSLMIYEEITKTLFPNDLFSSMGLEVMTTEDRSAIALAAARELGYQANDRTSLQRALDKIAPLEVRLVATMHGPTLIGHYDKLVKTFQESSLA
ncbi:MAG: hypothetical protein HY726_05895 [Candidatus Rokubacteria bacterium]|nr:hypothetical protein [Candidatus Rokubacteria bacterium]